MIKKLFTILLFITLCIFSISPVFAAKGEDDAVSNKLDILLPPSMVDAGVPKGSLKYDVIPAAIKIFLAVAATISFVVFVYAGVMLVIAQGNEEEVTKFKNVLIWSVVGLLFITAAYALVRGVLNLSFT
jgi:hypothetical protein